jgi:hypothetical protein
MQVQVVEDQEELDKMFQVQEQEEQVQQIQLQDHQ